MKGWGNWYMIFYHLRNRLFLNIWLLDFLNRKKMNKNTRISVSEISRVCAKKGDPRIIQEWKQCEGLCVPWFADIQLTYCVTFRAVRFPASFEEFPLDLLSTLAAFEALFVINFAKRSTSLVGDRLVANLTFSCNAIRKRISVYTYVRENLVCKIWIV